VVVFLFLLYSVLSGKLMYRTWYFDVNTHLSVRLRGETVEYVLSCRMVRDSAWVITHVCFGFVFCVLYIGLYEVFTHNCLGSRSRLVTLYFGSCCSSRFALTSGSARS
jgi:hypothetical protein